MEKERQVVNLIIELAVRILSEQSLSNSWQCIDLQKSQSLFKCVVDINFTATTDDRNTARSVCITISK